MPSLPKLHKWDIVYLEWLDTIGEGPGWQDDNDDDLVPPICINVGVVSQITKDYIKLFASSNSDSVSHKDSIPVGCIKFAIIWGRASLRLRRLVKRKWKPLKMRKLT